MEPKNDNERRKTVRKKNITKNQKVIRDSVHGYVYIDKDIFQNIIDTEYFQRLRRIEQTSMRCLYPAARHDRFIHSIGVYHLSNMVIDVIESSIIENASNFDDAIPNPEIRKDINFTFQMAALLHDIGHAPFSHTLEEFFGIKNETDIEDTISARQKRKHNQNIEVCNKAREKLKLEERLYNRLLSDLTKTHAASHELMSALLILECFFNNLISVAEKRDVKLDWEFLIRCITGAQYCDGKGGEFPEEKYKNYKNCIIRLLNSAIDIDKIDYISRDSSISGYDNVTIDIQRLLRALEFFPYTNDDGDIEIVLAFNKTAISVVQNTILSRNALYTWIYAHHKVKYETFLLKKSIEIIAQEQDSTEERLEFFNKYFSLEALKKNLICDDDIWCLLKNSRDKDIIKELFERNKQKKAIWKSFSEFEAYFNEKSDFTEIGSFSVQDMREVLEDEALCNEFKEYLNEFGEKEAHLPALKFELIIHNVKLTSLEHNNVLIYLNEKLYGYDVVIKELYPSSVSHPFFYLFYDRELADVAEENKEKLIEYIKKFDKFHVQPQF